MVVDFDRARRTHGPAHVTVLRGQLIDHHMDDQVAWADVASAARKLAEYADAQQRRAWKRVTDWDGPPDAA
jgi:hypothetical protein